ncbi:glycosyltransferase family 4 protein [Ancylothrix sp. C2]|uniref:glycosyltransferase family 4 protein n=1 Tax=Ancylothrix sp. D3o TaxID=2953691 RepID=UPI0021BA3DEB|nr:glycosyltransferase family 4 protein [Ancylothrix sp. D3o]MCT7949700.1 glycosyltransferase family 4 protein [Ancylothrix sp. D3o]
MTKIVKIIYAAGPGNVITTYEYWAKNQDDPSQVSVTYSGQFYDVCRDLDAEGYVISSSSDKKLLKAANFTLEHRPLPGRNASGIFYHLGQIWYGLRLIVSALLFKADFAVVADGTTHWFLLSLLPVFGVKVVPTLHCVLWRKYQVPSGKEKLILNLNRRFFAKDCTAILVASEDIAEQVKQLTGNQHAPIVEFLPTYRRSEFAGVVDPDINASPFRVLFAGRIERDKGVFDLLEIAKRFAAENRQNITFDVCGNGSQLESLRLAAQQAGVTATFVCYGYCNKPQMREMFNRSHAVIVPTTTDFVEGFNQVVAEAILAGRPVITSAVCPALSYVGSGVVEVPPNDTQAYGDAILKLSDDREFYEQKRRNCLALQEQFYDVSKGWAAALSSVIQSLAEKANLPISQKITV